MPLTYLQSMPETPWNNQEVTKLNKINRSNPQGNSVLPETTGRTLVTDLHQDTQLGLTKHSELLRPRYIIPRLDSLVKDISARCQVCAQVNPKQRTPYPGMGLNERSALWQTLRKLTSLRSCRPGEDTSTC